MVDFIKINGMQLRPIARTCGPVLESSSTYQNFLRAARRIPECVNWVVFVRMVLWLCLTERLILLGWCFSVEF